MILCKAISTPLDDCPTQEGTEEWPKRGRCIRRLNHQPQSWFGHTDIDIICRPTKDGMLNLQQLNNDFESQPRIRQIEPRKHQQKNII